MNDTYRYISNPKSRLVLFLIRILIWIISVTKLRIGSLFTTPANVKHPFKIKDYILMNFAIPWKKSWGEHWQDWRCNTTRNKNCTINYLFISINHLIINISNTFTIVISVVPDKSYAWATCGRTRCFNLQQRNFVAWQCLRWVVIRATTLFNLQRLRCKLQQAMVTRWDRYYSWDCVLWRVCSPMLHILLLGQITFSEPAIATTHY